MTYDDDNALAALHGITPDEAATIFASVYDPAIREVIRSLNALGMEDDEFGAILLDVRKLMDKNVPIDRDMTIGEAKGDVLRISDLLTLGELTYRLRQKFLQVKGGGETDADDDQ